jgi:hypothetical protein
MHRRSPTCGYGETQVENMCYDTGDGIGSLDLAHAAAPHQTQWARASNARAHPVTEVCLAGDYRLAANFLRAAVPAAINPAMLAKA